MKSSMLWGIIVLCLCSLNCYAGYIPLGTIRDGGGVGGTCMYVVTQAEFYWYGDPWTKLSWGNYTSADVGHTFYVDSHNANFSYFVSKLTNRADDDLRVRIGGRPGNGPDGGSYLLESEAIQKLVPTTYRDLAGYEIYNIGLTINSLTINWTDEPGPYGILGRVQMWYDVTYTINAIPEPATIALLALGGLLLRKRKEKSVSVSACGKEMYTHF
jgi:hypothetical protein